MRRSILVAFSVIIIITPFIIGQETILINDSFDTDSGWIPQFGTLEYNGSLKVTPSEASVDARIRAPIPDELAPSSFAFEVNIGDHSLYTAFGIVWWAYQEDNPLIHQLLVVEDGRYVFDLINFDGSFRQEGDYVSSGYSEIHTISVEVHGPAMEADLFLNDNFIDTIRLTQTGPSKIGLVAVNFDPEDMTAFVEFDNAIIRTK